MRFSFSFGDLGLLQRSSEPVSSQTKTVLPKTGSIAPQHHASMVRFSSFEIRSFFTVKNDTHLLQVVHITGLLPSMLASCRKGLCQNQACCNLSCACRLDSTFETCHSESIPTPGKLKHVLRLLRREQTYDVWNASQMTFALRSDQPTCRQQAVASHANAS